MVSVAESSERAFISQKSDRSRAHSAYYRNFRHFYHRDMWAYRNLGLSQDVIFCGIADPNAGRVIRSERTEATAEIE